MRRTLCGAIATGLIVATFGAARATIDTWQPETNLSLTATDSETGLNHRPLAVTPDGTLHVVWAEQDAPNQNYRIWTRRLVASSWTAAELIVDYLPSDPGTQGGAKYPALVPTPAGEIHLFWHDYRIGGINNVELFTKTRPAGGAWDPARAGEVRLTTTSHPETNGDNGYVPVPAVSPDGTLHVVWYDFRYDGQLAEILSKSRPAGGGWDLAPGDSADHNVSSDTAHSELAAAAVDAAGVLHVVWRSVESGTRLLYANRTGSGTWTVPALIDSSATVAGAPALTVDGSDAVHAVWPDGRSPEGGRALYTSVRGGNGTWSTPRQLTDPQHGADEPGLATAADGTLHLVWSDGKISLLNPEIFHREKSPGASWDTTGAFDQRVSEGLFGGSARPSVLAAGGSVFVTWRDGRDGNNELYFRRGVSSATSAPFAPRPSSVTLVAFPNPLRGGSVRFVRRDGAVPRALSVYDAAGRRLRHVRGNVWDGRTTAGSRVSAGVYLVTTPETHDAIRVTVIR